MRRLLALLVLLAAPAWAATYYVDNCDVTGNDGNNGTSTSTAWLTINKVNTSSFSAGDSILFRAGCTWREQLTVPSSGSAGNPITFGAYGSGEKPIIDGTNLVTPGTSWSAVAAGNANLIANPEAFNSWNAATRASISTNVATPLSPKNTQAVDGIIPNTDNNSHRVDVGFAVSASTAYTFSVYVKPGAGSNWIRINIMWFTSGWGYLDDAGSYFDITAGAGVLGATHWNDTSREILDVGGGWYRIRVTDSSPVGGVNALPQIASATADNTSTFVGDNTTVYTYLWGAKFENAASWSAYNVTNVWQATDTTEPSIVFFDGTRGSDRVALDSLYAARDWAWVSNVLYIYSATDPDTTYTAPGVEAGTRDRCIDLNSNDYVTVQDLALLKSNSIEIFTQDSNSITISGCEIAYAYSAGVYLWATGGTHNIGHNLNGCHVHHNGSSGLYVGNYGSGATIAENDVHDNCWSTAEDTNAGIKIYSGPYGTEDPDNNSGHTIEKNHIYSNGLASGYRGAGIWCDFSNNNTVRYNCIHDNLGVGAILVEKSSDCKVYGNVVYNETASHNANVGRGIHLSMDDGSEHVNNNLIYNNTVYNCRELLVVYGAGSTHTISNNLFKNNIFLGGVDNDIFYYPQGRDSGNVFSNNCLGAEPIDVDWNGAAKTTYDAWETSYGGTTNSVESDPLFTNAGTGDFTLQAGSPCIDAGVSLGASYLEQLLAGSTWPAAVETLDWHKTGGAPDVGAYGYRKLIW